MACSLARHDNDRYNVDEYGLLFRCLPRRTYLAPSETRKTARGCKAMKAKDRITGYACTNASGTHQVPMGVIGKTQQPRCFTAAGVGKPNNTARWRGLPLPYFQQRKAWSDKYVMSAWFSQEFLPHCRRTHPGERILLLLDNCGCHSPAEVAKLFHDPLGLVKVITAAEHDVQAAANGRGHHRLDQDSVQVPAAGATAVAVCSLGRAAQAGHDRQGGHCGSATRQATARA